MIRYGPWLLGLWLATPLSAGPWPRAAGEVFVASSYYDDGHIAHWIEYGLSEGRWLQAKLDLPRGNGPQEASVNLHQALPPWRGWVSALSFGVAVRRDKALARLGMGPLAGLSRPAMELGASLGRGIAFPLPGWISGRLSLRDSGPLKDLRAEATLGLRLWPRLSAIGQIELTRRPGEVKRLMLQTSTVWQIHPAFSLELGLETPLQGGGPAKAKLGSWINF